MRFTLRQLEYLVAACDTGTVTEAARRTRASQSTVSGALAQLERALGVELLVRQHAQGVVPTAAGRALLAEAREILYQAGELDRRARALAEDVGGPLAVGCLVTVAPQVAPALCRAFLDAHPAVDLRLVEGGQDVLLGGLRDGTLAVALTYDLGLADDIAFAPLAVFPPYAFVAADDPLAAAGAADLVELARRPLVLLDLPLSRDYFAGLFLARGLEPRIAARSPHPEVVRSLVANGYGYGLANLTPLVERAADGRPLAAVALAGDHAPLRLGLATRAGRPEPRVVAAFRAHCAARFASG